MRQIVVCCTDRPERRRRRPGPEDLSPALGAGAARLASCAGFHRLLGGAPEGSAGGPARCLRQGQRPDQPRREAQRHAPPALEPARPQDALVQQVGGHVRELPSAVPAPLQHEDGARRIPAATTGLKPSPILIRIARLDLSPSESAPTAPPTVPRLRPALTSTCDYFHKDGYFS